MIRNNLEPLIVIFSIVLFSGAIGYILHPTKYHQATELSVLTEQKKCEELGGQFYVGQEPSFNLELSGMKVIMRCTKSTNETLFDYVVK